MYPFKKRTWETGILIKSVQVLMQGGGGELEGDIWSKRFWKE